MSFFKNVTGLSFMKYLNHTPGSDLATMRELMRDLRQNGEDFPALLEELQSYL